MSDTSSPLHYSSETDFYDADFTKDISRKMRVPKKIRGTGDTIDDELLNNTNTNSVGWSGHRDNFDMRVPDRIMVAGQEQHIGSKSHPIEIMLEQSTLPPVPDQEIVRVGTPPRVLTLSEHYFPTADETPPNNVMYFTQRSPEIGKVPPTKGGIIDLDDSLYVAGTLPRQKQYYGMGQVMHREATPPIGPSGEGLSPSEEVLHLRRQMAKLNRRVLAIELDYLQRQQREKIMYAVGIAYMLLKAIIWLNK